MALQPTRYGVPPVAAGNGLLPLCASRSCRRDFARAELFVGRGYMSHIIRFLKVTAASFGLALVALLLTSAHFSDGARWLVQLSPY